MTHFFISDSDGALYDTRRADWFDKPLRPNYRRAHTRIDSVADLKAAIRAGNRTFPGSYPLFFVTSDGAALSFKAARDEFRLIAESIRNKSNDGWRIVACDVNYEDSHLICDHTGESIPSAYGDETE